MKHFRMASRFASVMSIMIHSGTTSPADEDDEDEHDKEEMERSMISSRIRSSQEASA